MPFSFTFGYHVIMILVFFIYLYRKDAAGRYASLYYQSRPRALESLNSLPELQQANQLKSKILFSVVVVSISY